MKIELEGNPKELIAFLADVSVLVEDRPKFLMMKLKQQWLEAMNEPKKPMTVADIDRMIKNIPTKGETNEDSKS